LKTVASPPPAFPKLKRKKRDRRDLLRTVSFRRKEKNKAFHPPPRPRPQRKEPEEKKEEHETQNKGLQIEVRIGRRGRGG
jgi:hypothetical protein